MRLIDANTLMDSLNSLCDIVCPYSKIQRSVMCGACLLGSALDVVDSTPTVDAVEVVRCKDCKWGRKACGNIECVADMYALSEYHGYEWYCPNGERIENE